MRVVVLGAAAEAPEAPEAPAGVEVRKGPEGEFFVKFHCQIAFRHFTFLMENLFHSTVDPWSVLCLGHDLDHDQHHQSNLQGM